LGILFAKGRRTAASWLRAAAVGSRFSDYYYFIAAIGRKSIALGTRLLMLLLQRLPSGPRVLVALDDTPSAPVSALNQRGESPRRSKVCTL
jgi:hypothetical protein